MEVILILICAMIALLFLLDIIWKPKLNIPTPYRIPIIGNMVFLGAKPHLTLTKWTKKYGNIFSLQVFGKSFVAITGYDAIYEMLVLKGNDTAGRKMDFRFHYVFNYEDGITMMEMSSKYKIINKYISRHIKRGLGYEKLLFDTSSSLIDSLTEDIKLHGCIINPYEHIHRSALNWICAFLTENRYEMSDPTLYAMTELESLGIKYLGMSEGLELSVLPWLRFFGSKPFKMITVVKEMKNDLFNNLRSKFQSKRDGCGMEGTEFQTKKDGCGMEGSEFQTKKDGCGMKGLFYAMIAEMENKQGQFAELFSHQFVDNVIFELMMAGSTTSKASLYTFILLMADYPDIQNKIYEEIKLQSNKKVDGSRIITVSDRVNMPYTQAALLEMERYCSFLPITLPHKATKDITIGGVHIPEDTLLVPNLWEVHHDEKFWDEPFKFCPERFIDGNSELVPGSHPNRKRIFSFGAGPRACLGQQLASTYLYISVTNILNHFNIERHESLDAAFMMSDPRNFDFGIASMPKQHKLKLNPRFLD